MPFVRAGQLARPTPVLLADDPIGLVAENLRATGVGALPVLDRLVTGGDEDGPGGPMWEQMARRARVIGVIDERDLSAAVLPILEEYETARQAMPVTVGMSLNGHGMPLQNGHHAPGSTPTPTPFAEEASESSTEAPIYPPLGDITSLTARNVMRHDFGIVPSQFSLHNALISFDRYDCAALPVIDPLGGYIGMLSRADVVAALGRYVRPPVIGGMATPLGVWLTTGTLSGGAPPLGLFLSGAMLGIFGLIAYFALLLPLALIDSNWAAMFVSGRLAALSDNGWFSFATTGLQGLIFLLVMRASPLAGVHAAEHQTVWAIERGLPLTPEIVAQMPRPHPRCGTNLMVLATLIVIIFQHLPSFDPIVILIALLFIYMTWRTFGELLQNYFTTKPATRKQLESGIRAGKEVLEKYQDQPHIMPPFSVRLLRSGLVYSALGIMLVLWGLMALQTQMEAWILGLS